MRVRRIVSLVLPALVAVLVLGVVATGAFASTLPLSVSANGKVFGVPASLITSFSPTGSTVDTAGVTTWIGAVAVQGGVYHKVVNYTSTVDKKKKKLVFSHNAGFSLDQSAAVTALCAALSAETTDTFPASTLTLASTAASKNPKKLGKQILVIQSLHKFYVYDNDKIIRTYRCAVGMSAYPTPNGTFHIGKKDPHPTWTNGYAPWSKSMPAFIGAGPNNPLGTRAMYVYTGAGPTGGKDTGVRFHGVPHSEDSSIGHSASHGCLRMHRKDVEALYPIIPMGTTVYIIK